MGMIERQLQQNLNKNKNWATSNVFKFSETNHSVYISVGCASNMMTLFYIYIDHLFQLLRNLLENLSG